jgi:hypothetical protein
MNRPRVEVAGVAALVAAALVVRLLTYRQLPWDINNDEIGWGWVGQSILFHGKPASWSYLPGYPTPSVMASPVTGHLLPWQPHWLDHPPLFALLVGVVEAATGETTPADVSLAVIRLVPVVLSTVSVVLLYVLVRRHLGWVTAAAAAVLFAFAPVAVSASALVEAEWLLAPMLLLALLLATGRTRPALAGLVLVCALAPMVKVAGVIVAGSACALLLSQRRWHRAAAVAAAGVAGLLLFAAWGAYVDWNLFIAITRSQVARHSDPVNPFGFLMSLGAGYGNHVPFRDPVWYAGLLGVAVALVLSAVRRRWTALVLTAPVVGMTVLMLVIEPGVAVYASGWYRLAIYPLVYAAAAWLVVGAARTLARHAMVPLQHARTA